MGGHDLPFSVSVPEIRPYEDVSTPRPLGKSSHYSLPAGCRTFSDPVRRLPVVMPRLLSMLFSNQGSFPPPALPGIRGTTSPSATLPTRPDPRGVPVGVCAPPTGLPVLLPHSSCMHASVKYPGGCEPVHVSLSSRSPAVFPFSAEGRHPHCPFRGLLDVRSRSGLHAR